MRKIVLIPDSAHGTNPATAAMCGYQIKVIPSNKDGLVEFSTLKQIVDEHQEDIAGIMLTNPNTCGKFEPEAKKIADLIHSVGAYFYCDGANFNAIVGKIKPVDDEAAKLHFEILVETLTKNAFEHYEFSNFGKPGYFSENNTAYWLGKPYLGIGPAAHSYDGNSRKWNISNNPLYIKALENDKIPQETEYLSLSDKYNEYVMTRLRTKFGVELAEVSGKFGEDYKAHFLELAKPLQKEDLLQEKNGIYHITSKGKFLSDGIAADLFFLD